jgi:hypothetical protein
VPGQVEGQARAREDDVGAFVDRGIGQLAVVGQGAHYVHADDAVGRGLGQADFGPQSVRLDLGGAAQRADAGGGDDADCAALRDRGCQPGKGNAHTHAALHDRQVGYKVTDLQLLHDSSPAVKSRPPVAGRVL